MTDASRRYVINTYPYTFSHSALACLQHLVDRGFSGFEVMMFPGHIWPAHASRADRHEIRRFLSASGAAIKTLNQPNIDINIGAAVPEMREYSVSAIEKVIVLAADLECPGVIIGSGKPNQLWPAPTAEMEARFFAALDRFVPLAEKLGVTILLENMPFAYLPRVAGMVKTLDKYGADGIGIVYDVANGAFTGEDIGEALRRAAPRLKHVHLSDTPAETCRHDPISGEGIVRFDIALQAMKDIGHAEPAIIEIVSSDADASIDSSITYLTRLGWPV